MYFVLNLLSHFALLLFISTKVVLLIALNNTDLKDISLNNTVF